MLPVVAALFLGYLAYLFYATALLDAVNAALAELTADGTIPAIVEKYIPTK